VTLLYLFFMRCSSVGVLHRWIILATYCSYYTSLYLPLHMEVMADTFETSCQIMSAGKSCK